MPRGVASLTQLEGGREGGEGREGGREGGRGGKEGRREGGEGGREGREGGREELAGGKYQGSNVWSEFNDIHSCIIEEVSKPAKHFTTCMCT